MKSLDERIKDTGLKKSFIAERLGISPATLSRIISGKQGYVSDELKARIEALLDGPQKM
jgi:DNA-binding LacI/PurR family transcriptional regulator